jgi:hypothetical protein
VDFIFSLISAFLSLWLCSSAALAGSVDDIRARGLLRVGTSGDYQLIEHQLTLRLAEEEITTAGLAAEAKRQLGEALWKARGRAKYF